MYNTQGSLMCTVNKEDAAPAPAAPVFMNTQVLASAPVPAGMSYAPAATTAPSPMMLAAASAPSVFYNTQGTKTEKVWPY